MATDVHFSEILERRLLADIHEVAGAKVQEEMGLRAEVVGDAFVSIAACDPGNIILNRAIGLGGDKLVSAETVSSVVAAYRDAGVKNFFVHVADGDQAPPLRNMLLGEGLVKRRGWVKFVRDVSPPPEVPSSFTIRQIDNREDALSFGRIAAYGFDMSDAFSRLTPSLLERPNVHMFMTFDGDTPIGTGMLYVMGNAGWLDFGSTDPRYRMKGSQRSLMNARIRHAISLGCQTLFTGTGEEVDGDPQHSYGNILKAGFKPVYTRENYGPPKG